MEQLTFSFNIVVYRGVYGWIARCLENNLIAQGSDIAEVKDRIERTLALKIILDLEDNKIIATLHLSNIEFF